MSVLHEGTVAGLTPVQENISLTAYEVVKYIPEKYILTC